MIRFWQSKNSKDSKGEEDGSEQTVCNKKFICPLSSEIMVEPVTIRDGSTYERVALTRFMEVNGEISPMSGKPLGQPAFFPNKKLAWAIQKYKADLMQRHEAKGSEEEASSVQQAASEQPQGAVGKKLNLPTSKVQDYTVSRSSTNFPAQNFPSAALRALDKADVVSILDEVCEIQMAA